MRGRGFSVSLLVAVVLLPDGSGAEAATVPISRGSSLAVSGRTSQGEFQLEDRFDTFGSYVNALDQSLPGAGGGTTRASASQQSDVDPVTNTGSATGDMFAQVAELDAIAANAANSFSFTFDVIGSPELMSLEGHVQSSFDAFAQVLVQRPGEEPAFQRTVDVGESARIDFDEELLLSSGRYVLTLEGFANGTPSGGSAEFDATFSLANPIPLPPAVWSGAAGLACALFCIRRMSATKHA